jgi:type IV secretion system protein VirD4
MGADAVSVTARAALVAATALVAAVAWPPLTSAALHNRVPWTTKPSARLSWAAYAPAYFYWRDHGQQPAIRQWLVPCAAGSGGALALLPGVITLALVIRPRRRLRPGRPSDPVPEPERALSDTHGSARRMTAAEALQLFRGGAHGEGGIVLGQLGEGGDAPLLVDACNSDAPHGIIIGGSGSGKTAAVTIPTLDPTVGWPGSIVVHDPKCKVAAQTSGMRIAAGQRVVVLKIDRRNERGQGMNVLDWIDPADPEATAHVRSTVCMIGKEQPEKPASDPVWRESAEAVLFAVLAHMLWDSTLSREEKTLARFARMVALPQRELRSFLQEIHETSECEEARITAGTLMDAPDKTFGSYVSGAQSDIRWLLNPAYAALVSRGDLRSDELGNGRTTVYVQIPMDTLKDTPEVARTIFNALFRGVYRLEGRGGRVAFLLDEMHLLGRMKALEIARDVGREFGIILVPMWQSLGQITAMWEDGGKRDWFSSAGWTVFAAVDPDTAKEISGWAGTYTGFARTENTSTGSTGGSGGGSSNRSKSAGLHEVPIPVIRADKIQQLHRHKRIVFRPGAPGPLFCDAALWFNRPEMEGRIAPTPP